MSQPIATDFSGSAEITDEGIKDHFKSFDPVKAVFELIWNGLDANATLINLNIKYTELGAVDHISALDNGDGIDVKNIENNFKRFNESIKRHDEDKHGSHGKGRLSFHKICGKARWYTKREDYNAVITISSKSIKDYEGHYINNDKQNSLLLGYNSGTYVDLAGPYKNGIPEEEKITEKIRKEFGWFIALNENIDIYVNKNKVCAPSHEIFKNDLEVDNDIFKVTVIRWDGKPTSVKSYNYFVTNKSRIIEKSLSKFNNKKSFYISSYISSSWFENYNPNMLRIDPDYAKTKNVLEE